MADILKILWSWLTEIFRKILPEKSKNINGKVVLITGAGGGIGRQLALKFAAENTKLALLDLDKNSCDETASLVNFRNVRCHSYVCDVSKREEVKNVAVKIREDLGEVDILINNAGIVTFKPFFDLTETDVRQLMDINLLGSYWTILEFMPEMFRRNEGHVVNMSSIAGCLGVAMCSSYSASKFALRGLSESLMEEASKFKKTGVHVSVVYPSFVDTKMCHNVPNYISLEEVKFLAPEEVADAVLDGVLKNKKQIFIPKTLLILNAMNKLLPTNTMSTIRSVLPLGVKYDDEFLQNDGWKKYNENTHVFEDK